MEEGIDDFFSDLPRRYRTMYNPKVVSDDNRLDLSTRMLCLKSQLKARHVFLESETRIGRLVFVTDLALVVYCLLEHMLKEAGIDESVRELFRDLDYILQAWPSAWHGSPEPPSETPTNQAFQRSRTTYDSSGRPVRAAAFVAVASPWT